MSKQELIEQINLYIVENTGGGISAARMNLILRQMVSNLASIDEIPEGNLMIGTAAQREAVTPKEGLFWAEIENDVFTTLYCYKEGEWQEFSSGSGGGVPTGTQAERLAYENPYNGLYFNQIDENGVVTRYVYSGNQWVLILDQSATDERVEITLTSDNGEAQISGKNITVVQVFCNRKNSRDG